VVQRIEEDLGLPLLQAALSLTFMAQIARPSMVVPIWILPVVMAGKSAWMSSSSATASVYVNNTPKFVASRWPAARSA